jgi:hypothetical protein
MRTLRFLLLAIFIKASPSAVAQAGIATVPPTPVAGSHFRIVAPIDSGACPSPDWVTVGQPSGAVRINVNYPTVPPPSTCPGFSVSAGPLPPGHYVVEAYLSIAGSDRSLYAAGAFDVVAAVPIPVVSLESGTALILSFLIATISGVRHRRATTHDA